MINNLYFFNNIHISKFKKWARFLSGIFDFIEAANTNRILFLSFLSAVFFFSAALVRYASYLLNRKFSFLFLILAIELVFVLFYWVCLKLGKRISYRFNCRFTVGIKDTWFFIAAFNVYGICLLPIQLGSTAFLFLVASGILFIVLGLFWIYYEKIIAVKKQPDLDIPYVLTADSPCNFTVLGGPQLKKIQINGDTRDAFILKEQEEVEVKLPETIKRIKFAVGIREAIGSLKGAVLVNIFDKSNTTSELIYSRVLEPVLDPIARSWLEVDITLPVLKSKGQRVISIKVQSYDGNNKKCYDKPLCFSGPIISNCHNPKKIILIVLDAVRADHVGCYGYGRPVTSYIDEFSKDSVFFKTAIVQGEWTLPSFMSMLTGMYPSGHNVYHHTHYHSLDKNIPTLQEILRSHGFVTRCYFTHKRLMSHFGFARGFDSHLFRQCDKENNIATADDVTNKALDMLQFHQNDNLFLMLHYFDTHQPCGPLSPYADLFDQAYGRKVIENVREKLLGNKDLSFDNKDLKNLIARYDAEIYRVDFKIGMILDYLKRTGQYEESLIIITSDHGILLGDHGSLTKITLFDETVRVPLLAKFPASFNLPKNLYISDCLIEANVDLMPTILELYGISQPTNIQGHSFLPLVKKIDKDIISYRRDYALSESLFGNAYTVSLRNKDHRYTFRTKFDITAFKNYKENNISEQVFKVNIDQPESEISVEGKENLLNKYRPIIQKHIKEALEVSFRNTNQQKAENLGRQK